MGTGQVRVKEFSRKPVLSVLLVFVTPVETAAVDEQGMMMTVSLICWGGGGGEGEKSLLAN